ncbi:MAG: imidazoleglycerol-phosphate dehydratase HisB [Syntrophobacteraceae bacterium]
MTSQTRKAVVDRKTKETQIRLELDLDGSGEAELSTGAPFLDHMLTLFAVHGFFDIAIQADGDLEIDAHHTVEDIGICLGEALSRALGDRRSIRRYGHAMVPMDEACARVVLDISNRPYLVLETPGLADRVGQFETELLPEFFRAVCLRAGLTLHIQVLHGRNTHHMIEAIFKAFGRALDDATRFDERRTDVPSSKGTL